MVSQDFIIVDDDVDLSVDDIRVIEGDEGTTDAVFTLMLSQASPVPVTLQVQTGNFFSATAGDDYVSIPLTDVTFQPGETEQTVTITVNGDEVFENDEQFALNLSAVQNATLIDSQGVATIVNDDAGVSINDVDIVEGDDGTSTATFTLTLSAASSESVTLDFALTDDTATAGQDYVDTGVVPIAFAPGETTATVDVTINGDNDVEPFESFQARLSNIVGANIDDGVGVATIQNDDAELTLIAVDGLEGTASAGTVRFDARLTQPVVQTVSGTLTTTAGTATTNDDFLAIAPVTLSIPPGFTTASQSVATIADSAAEPHESISGTLSGFGDVSVIESTADALILNDDAVFRIAKASVTEGDDGTTPLVFDVTLDQPVAFSVSIDIDTVDGTASDGSDYNAVNQTIGFAPNQNLNNLLH